MKVELVRTPDGHTEPNFDQEHLDAMDKDPGAVLELLMNGVHMLNDQLMNFQHPEGSHFLAGIDDGDDGDVESVGTPR